MKELKESFSSVNKHVQIEEVQTYDSNSRKTGIGVEVRLKSDKDSNMTSTFVLDQFAAFELYRDLKNYLRL